MQWNPQQRATASQLLAHPFVKSSWPFGKQIVVSTSSGHPAATNAAKSEVLYLELLSYWLTRFGKYYYIIVTAETIIRNVCPV